MGRPLTESILVDVAAVMKTAWGANQIRIGQPQSVPTAFPYVSVQASQITRRSGSPTQQTYDYNILVTGRFAYPTLATDFIGTEQIERMNDAIDALLNSATLNAVSYGTLTDVSEMSFDESEDSASRYYEVSFVFNITINGVVRP